mmetsp:Transcript_66276/g.183059  ORF Transcript_66276/g.183059 Transcript_66276/m.183059 type:complete len:104 (+) Transcript_66276:527-838(+)
MTPTTCGPGSANTNLNNTLYAAAHAEATNANMSPSGNESPSTLLHGSTTNTLPVTVQSTADQPKTPNRRPKHVTEPIATSAGQVLNKEAASEAATILSEDWKA